MAGKIIHRIYKDDDLQIFLKCPICKIDYIFPQMKDNWLIPYNNKAVDVRSDKPNVTVSRDSISCDKCEFTIQYIDTRIKERNVNNINNMMVGK